MPSSRTSTRSAPSSTRAVTSARVARACLTTLVSASATMKYALASISGGSRARVTSTSTGRSRRDDEASTPAAQAAARQDRRQDPVGQLAQLGVALLRVVERLGEQRLRLLASVAERPLRELERDDRVDQALLGAVVEVADDPPARLVARGEHARAGRGELIAAVGVRDRRVEQLRELGQALLGVGGRQVLPFPARGDHAPEPRPRP